MATDLDGSIPVTWGLDLATGPDTLSLIKMEGGRPVDMATLGADATADLVVAMLDHINDLTDKLGAAAPDDRKIFEKVLAWAHQREQVQAQPEATIQDSLKVAPEEAPAMPADWSVTVQVDGETVATIGHDWISSATDFDEDVILGAAKHLLSFIGYGLPPLDFNPDDDGGAAKDSTARMFEAACMDLGSIAGSLGIDSETDGGAEPILQAIEDLRKLAGYKDMQVFEMDDVEWWIGPSYRACLAAQLLNNGGEVSAEDWARELEPLTAERLAELTYQDDDGPDRVERSFAEQLAIERQRGGTFPRCFASTDF